MEHNNANVKLALTAARAMITDPERWTKGALARDEGGAPVLPYEEGATCWCAIGALMLASGVTAPAHPSHWPRDPFLRARRNETYAAAETLLDAAATIIARRGEREPGAISLNDASVTSHADVLAAFDHAMASLSDEPA
ncbi:MAG: hypothetical protein FJX76_16575 [Armatimonadetes bacterium]|nr:hypothetical protein [Armatimonadota bacterium]